MKPETVIVYIDLKGLEHNALLIEEDQRHAGFVSLVYLNRGIAQRMVGVAHESHESKDESNPDLPRVALNCWREVAAEVAPEQPGTYVLHEGDELPEFIAKPINEAMAALHEQTAKWQKVAEDNAAMAQSADRKSVV